jgi:hypothetical protein
MAVRYAPDAMVAAVARTPMRPVRVAATAALAPGSMTPRIGMSRSIRSCSGAIALTVLQAMTSALTSRVTRWRAHESA